MAKPRSAGQYALARLGRAQDTIAADVGHTRQLVSMWLRGDRKPNATARATLERLYGIVATAWDEPHAPAKKQAVIAAKQDAAVVATPVARNGDDETLERLRRVLDRDLGALESDLTSTPQERGKVLASLTSTRAQIGRMTGDSQAISESKILRLPAWRRIEAALLAALTPWPAAMRAAGEALKGLGE